MNLASHPETQQSALAGGFADAPALPGTWKLAAGRAVTLQPREAGTFKVAHGQMWVTQDGPHEGPANNLGDRIVGAGETVRLRAGQRLVVESWNWQSPSYFSWDPLPAAQRAAAPRFSALVQPLADLRLALAFGAGAIGRLAGGFAIVGSELVAGRRQSAFNGPAQACRAH